MASFPAKPNFLFILTDDQGPWALNCAGTPELNTPHLDRLAAEGVRFDQFFCASPVCSPARASILTGRIPSAHGVHDWLRCGNVDRARMDRLNLRDPYAGYQDEFKPIQYLAGQKTYTDALTENGYACALSGKWHLGDSLTPQHGFRYWYTIGKGGAYYMHPDIVEKGTVTIEDAYLTDLITDKALLFLDELADREEPFYLSVHYTAPHSPWEADQHQTADIALYGDCSFPSLPDLPDHPNITVGKVHGTPKRHSNLRGYFAAITAMDRSVGRLLDALERKKLRGSTIVVFLSDNGMCMGQHGIWGKGNGTFPQNMFEESVKVPFIIAWPGVIDRNRVCSRLTSALDLYPTLLELAGIRDPQAAGLPGESFAPALCGNPAAETDDDARSIVICEEYGPVRMIRTRRWKYVHRYPYGPHELYDLENDPGELTNRIDDPELQDQVLLYRGKLENWFRRYVNPDLDGAKEPVTGLGQMCRAGRYADRTEKYKAEPGR